MEDLLFHPKLVHLPMALATLMPLVASGLLAAWWRKWLPRRAWVVALALQTVLLASSVAAMQSGETEEHRVERVVAECFIEEHEEAAELFTQVSAAVLLLTVLGFALKDDRKAMALAGAATLGTLVVLGLGYRTGEAGGELVYKHGAAQAYTSPSAAPAPNDSEHD